MPESKRRKFLLVCMGAFLSISIGFSSAQQANAADEVTEWVMQPGFGPEDAGWALGVIPWIEAVEKATKGTVKIKLLPGGSITSTDESFTATIQGVTDVYAGWATHYGGDFPEGYLAYGQALTSLNTEEQWEILWGDNYRVGDIVQKAANKIGLQWVGHTNQGPNGSFGNFKVEKWEDYEGKKLMAGGPQASYLAAMGGIPVDMPPTDIYQAIKLGTVEGTFWDIGGTDDMSFYEVVKYFYMPAWCGAQHQEIFLNMDKWEALEKWQQDAIMGTFKDVYFLTSHLHAENVQDAIDIAIEHGVEVLTMSDGEQERVQIRVREKVWPQTAALSPETKKGMEMYLQWMKDKGRM